MGLGGDGWVGEKGEGKDATGRDGKERKGTERTRQNSPYYPEAIKFA